MNWKSVVRSVAPTLGAALGGPLGGIATKFLSDALLEEDDDTSHLPDIITGANQETLVKIKELELQFKREMERLEVDVFALEVKDRDSARSAHSDNWFPEILTISLTGMVSWVIFLLVSGVEISDSSEAILFGLVGSVSTAWIAACSYYFGGIKGNKGIERDKLNW